MSKSIVDLINDLQPARAGYEHLAVSSERDLAEVLLDRAGDLGELLKRYDDLDKRHGELVELYERAESDISLYEDADEESADLNEDYAAILHDLIRLLRKED